MSRFDTGNMSYQRRLRDSVVIINVTRWMEAAALVAGYLMILGLLDLLERMR